MSQYSNLDSPLLEHKQSSKSQHSITLENIPSGRQTLERHHSGKSKYATATLERVPSNGVKHSDTINSDSDISIVKNNSLMVMSPTTIGKSSSLSGKSPQPKSILKNANSVNSVKLPSTTSPDDINMTHNLRRKKSKSRKSVINSTNDISTPHYLSMSRKSSAGILRGDSAKSYGENVPTTPLKPPQLTVFGHAVATPPTPKSTRFPQDAKVLPPVERAVLVPPDILGGTDAIPLNTMTLQRKHFHKRNKSVNAATVTNDYNNENIMMKTKTDHPLPIPPPHRQKNNYNEVVTASSVDYYQYKNSERVGRSREQYSNDYHYRSKSLPRPNKYNHNATRYVDDSSSYSPSVASQNTSIIMELERKLTSFEIDYFKDNEMYKMTHIRSKNSVLSILYEEKMNMDYYIKHCDD